MSKEENFQEKELINNLSDKLGLPVVLVKILVNRGIKTVSEYNNFIFPSLKKYLENFLEMELGCFLRVKERIQKAVDKTEKVLLISDYDVDGITSSVILYDYLKSIGITNLEIYIPDRITEGYGLNHEIVERVRGKFDLVFSLDCGITDIREAEQINSSGVDLIILDHHLAGDILPTAYEIINPKVFQWDDKVNYHEMAAVGIIFLLVCFLEEKNQDVFFRRYLPLVALGTVCDIVPLRDINRVFVIKGIMFFKELQHYGLLTLGKLLNFTFEKTKCSDLGFLFGPLINSSGRMGKAETSWKLLSFFDKTEVVDEIAQTVVITNNIRKEKQEEGFDFADNFIQKKDKHCIFVYNQNIHVGVLGIIASKLVEVYKIPSVVVTTSDNNLLKGSCRSVPGIDLGRCILEAVTKGILLDGGGHALAGGFSLEASKLDEFKLFLKGYCDYHKDQLKIKNINAESVLNFANVTKDLFYQIEKLSPFGNKNPRPLFFFRSLRIIKTRVFREIHLSCTLEETRTGLFMEGFLPVLAKRKIGIFILSKLGQIIDVTGSINLSEYLGRKKIQILIKDVHAPI